MIQHKYQMLLLAISSCGANTDSFTHSPCSAPFATTYNLKLIEASRRFA